MQLSSVKSKFVVISELFSDKPTYVKQNITGGSWVQVFPSFRLMVMDLHKEWYQYLKRSLDSEEVLFDCIRLNTNCACGILYEQFEKTAHLSGQEI